MLQMGNTLVDLTDQITKQSVKFLKTFNKQFTYVRLDQFIFCEADYIQVAIREVNEISEIFATYELELHKLKNTHMYVPPRRDDDEQIRVN